MTWISEDPWPIAGALLVAAVVGLLMARFTTQGKFLVWGLAAIGLAAVLLLVERFWVTDRERIEATLHGIADAAKRSDYTALEGFLAPEFGQPSLIGRAYIRGTLEATEFEFIHLGGMSIGTPGRQTRQATAEVTARASWKEKTRSGGPDFNATTPKGVRFAVGVREVAPKVWKVTRIELIDTGTGNLSPEDALRYMPR